MEELISVTGLRLHTVHWPPEGEPKYAHMQHSLAQVDHTHAVLIPLAVFSVGTIEQECSYGLAISKLLLVSHSLAS